MTTGDKFQRHSFKLKFKLKVKSVRGRLFTFDTFEEKKKQIARSRGLMHRSRSRSRSRRAGKFCPEPEPEPEPSKSFTQSRSRSRSRNASLEPEPEPEPTKNVTAPHPCLEAESSPVQSGHNRVGIYQILCKYTCNNKRWCI